MLILNQRKLQVVKKRMFFTEVNRWVNRWVNLRNNPEKIQEEILRQYISRSGLFKQLFIFNWSFSWKRDMGINAQYIEGQKSTRMLKGYCSE